MPLRSLQQGLLPIKTTAKSAKKGRMEEENDQFPQRKLGEAETMFVIS